ncbi:MAG: hypothetical protein IPM45_14520 [Acidimicrobiales bacterium]|nr:hypothetical protein [Acidimicrobiales bacterium]
MSVEVGAPSDHQLVQRIRRVVDRCGWAAIDAPFGFPLAFSTAVCVWLADELIGDPVAGRPDWLSRRPRGTRSTGA